MHSLFAAGFCLLAIRVICAQATSPLLSVAKMPSGLNAFEISDTQEENLTPG